MILWWRGCSLYLNGTRAFSETQKRANKPPKTANCAAPQSERGTEMARYARIVGYTSSYSRENPWRQEANSKRFHLHLVKSIAKSKKYVHSSLTKITCNLKLKPNNWKLWSRQRINRINRTKKYWAKDKVATQSLNDFYIKFVYIFQKYLHFENLYDIMHMNLKLHFDFGFIQIFRLAGRGTLFDSAHKPIWSIREFSIRKDKSRRARMRTSK